MKGSLFISLLVAFLTFIIIGIATKFSDEPFVKIIPAVSAFLVFRLIRSQGKSNTDEAIINKKEEVNDDEICVKEISTGKIKNIKRTDWKKIIANGEQNMYEVVYN